MSQTSTLKGQCIAEFLGTGLLIFFGVGCVAALKVAGASFGQWEISIIWGLGVAMAIYLTAGVSGAHLNPAVTIALWCVAVSKVWIWQAFSQRIRIRISILCRRSRLRW